MAETSQDSFTPRARRSVNGRFRYVIAVVSVIAAPAFVVAVAAQAQEFVQFDVPPPACVSEDGSNEFCADGTALAGASATAVSPDGKSVYVASADSDAVAVFSRQKTTANHRQGKVTQLSGFDGCISETGSAGCANGRGLGHPTAVAVSPDNKSVYVASGDAIAVFSRNTTTGKLTQLPGVAGCVTEPAFDGCAAGLALNGPNSIAVSADNKSVYVASTDSNAVAVFARQTTTAGGTQGKLTQLAGTAGCVSDSGAGGCATGLGLVGAFSVAVSKDNKSVYVASLGSDSVTAFKRQTTTSGGTQGKLTQLAGEAACVSETGVGLCIDGRALDSPRSVAVSADNKSVYVASYDSDAVAVFARQTSTTGGTQGRLTQLPGGAGCVSASGADDCTNGLTALGGAHSVAVSADGKSVYVAAYDESAVLGFSRQTTTTGGMQGRLTEIPNASCYKAPGGGCRTGHGLSGARSVAVSADGKSVYVASKVGSALAAFVRLPTSYHGLEAGFLHQFDIDSSFTRTTCTADTTLGGRCYHSQSLDGAAAGAMAADRLHVASAEDDAVVSLLPYHGALLPLSCADELGAGGCTDARGLDEPISVAVSPDQKNVYVASNISDAIAVFSISSSTLGQLVQLPGTAGCVSATGADGCAVGTGLDGAHGVTVSADGKSVYAVSSGSDAVAVFARQTTTTGGTLGKLTQLPGTAGCVSEAGVGGCATGTGLDGAHSVAVSRDNKSVYVASYDSDAVTTFARQTTTTGGTQGKLTQLPGAAGCVSDTGAGGCADARALDYPYSVAVSPDNKTVYATSYYGDAIAIFSRQTITTGGTQGKLTQLAGAAGCVQETGAEGCADGKGLDGAHTVAVSPDGKSVFVASFDGDALGAFSRQTGTIGGMQGKLTQLLGGSACVSETGADGCTNGVALDGARTVIVGPDSNSVFATSYYSDAVTTFTRTP